MNRREFLKRSVLAASFLAVAASAGLGLLESQSGRQGAPQSAVLDSTTSPLASPASAPAGSSTTTTSSGVPAAPSGYVYLAPLSAMQGRTYAYFTHPAQGSCILVSSGGQWRAFSAVCTHAGCTVQLSGQSLYCPCHAGYFSALNGSVQRGPPPSPLAEFAVIAQGSDLYVSLARTN